MFTKPFHTVNNPKKDLAAAIEKRSHTTISNMHFPVVAEKDRKFRPIKHLNWYV